MTQINMSIIFYKLMAQMNERQSIEDMGAVKTFYDVIMMDMCHLYIYANSQSTPPEKKSKVHYGLWVIMSCPYGFINNNKYTTFKGGCW